MPYGNKCESWLNKRVTHLITYLKTVYKVDLIIIACNTASAVLKYFNDETIIKMKFEEDKLYLTTNLTKQKLDERKHVNSISSKNLAKEIEFNIFNEEQLIKIAKKHIKSLKLDSFDEVILGCTHYELIKEILKNNSNARFINNSDKIINLV